MPAIVPAAARRGVRRTVTAARAIATAREQARPYAVGVFGSRTLELRVPRLADGPQWSAARRAEQARLVPAFGTDVERWAAEQTELAWAERCVRLRWAHARGAAWPGVLSEVGGRFLGEIGADAVDLRTRTGELSGWSAGIAPAASVPWSMAAVILHAFTASRPLARMVAPVGVDNWGPVRALRYLGFEREATLCGYRDYDGRAADHHVYVLHNLPETRAGLDAILARRSPTVRAVRP